MRDTRFPIHTPETRNAPLFPAMMRTAIVALVALVPIFFIPSSVITIQQSKMLLLTASVLLMVLAVLALALRGRVPHLPSEPLFYMLSVLPIAYAVSGMMTGWNGASFVGTGTEPDTIAAMMLWYALAVLTALVLSGGAPRGQAIARAITLGSFAVLVFQALRLVLPDPHFLSFGGVFPSLSDTPVGAWHDLALLAGLSAFTAVSSAAYAPSLWRIILVMAGCAAFLFLPLTGFRDVWLSTGALFSGYGVFLLVRGVWCGSVPWARVLAFALIGSVLVSLAPHTALIMQAVPERIRVSAVEVRPSWDGTFAVGRSVVGGGSLVFGSGPNSFSREWNRYKPSLVNTTEFWSADFDTGVGVIPTTFITIGALGIFAWVLITLALAWTGRRLMRPVAERAGLPILFFSSWYLLAAHMMSVPSPAISSLTFILLGTLIAAVCREDAEHPTVRLRASYVRRIAVGVAVALGGCIVLYASVSLARASVSESILRATVAAYARDAEIAKAERGIARALTVYPESDRAHRAAVELGLITLDDVTRKGASESDKEQLRAHIADTLAHGLSAVQLNGGEVQNWISLAALYQTLAGAGIEGSLEKAREAYERARAEDPTDPELPLRLAQIAIAQKEYAEAERLLKESITLKPDLAAAWYLLGSVEYTIGSFEAAARSLEQAVSLVDGYANAMYLLALSYQQLGKTDVALALLRAIAVQNPDNAELRAMIERMQNDTSGTRKIEPLSGGTI